MLLSGQSKLSKDTSTNDLHERKLYFKNVGSDCIMYQFLIIAYLFTLFDSISLNIALSEQKFVFTILKMTLKPTTFTINLNAEIVLSSVIVEIKFQDVEFDCIGSWSLPFYLPGRLAQSWASLTANQGVAGSNPGPATFFRWDLVIKIFYDHSLPSADSRRAVVSYWRKNGTKYW